MKKRDKIKYITRKLKNELRWKAISRKDITQALISMYYLVRDAKFKNRRELAELIISWESEYADYNTKKDIDEMLDLLYSDIVEYCL